MNKQSAKLYPFSALESLAAVILFAYLWCTRSGAVSVVFSCLTLVFAAGFVYAVNKLSRRIAPVDPLHGDAETKGRNAA